MLGGSIEFPLLLLLPVPNGYELAFAMVPLFFITIGILMAIFYWAVKKIIKRDVPILFHVLFYGLVLWQVFAAMEMAFDIV